MDVNNLRYAAEISLELYDVELVRIAKLSELLNQDVPTVIRNCLNERVTELLQMLEDHEAKGE